MCYNMSKRYSNYFLFLKYVSINIHLYYNTLTRDHSVRRNFHNPTNLRDKIVSSSYSYIFFGLNSILFHVRTKRKYVYVVVLLVIGIQILDFSHVGWKSVQSSMSYFISMLFFIRNFKNTCINLHIWYHVDNRQCFKSIHLKTRGSTISTTMWIGTRRWLVTCKERILILNITIKKTPNLSLHN